MKIFPRTPVWGAVVCLVCLPPFCALARQNDGSPGSRNIEMISHLPLGRSVGDVLIEQEAGRPFVFVARAGDRPGVVAINISQPSDPFVVGNWEADEPIAGLVSFRHSSRNYIIVSLPRSGAVVLGVSDPDEGTFDEEARINVDEGLQHVFVYRHSNGGNYLFATGGKNILVYDIDRLVSGSSSVLASIGVPGEPLTSEYGFHSMMLQYDVETESDRLYAAGAGGYYIFDVTDLQNPTLLASISSAAVEIGRTVSATPDGTHIVTGAGYRTAPLRIFDIRPALDGTVTRVRTAAGAWTANWRSFAENFELRWPFVFVASMEEGLQVFNMMNPFEPYTVGFYHTWDGGRALSRNRANERGGAWDIDVRNRDGLIAVTDVNTGLWLFRMEGFEGWDGRGWGLPNVSSVQDWDHGPVGSESW